MQGRAGELLSQPRKRAEVQPRHARPSARQARRQMSPRDDARDVVRQQDGDRRHRVIRLDLTDYLAETLQGIAAVARDMNDWLHLDSSRGGA